ncbi:MAG: AsnC family transcriptional regulator, partial [Nitrososphaeraceae archaeon]
MSEKLPPMVKSIADALDAIDFSIIDLLSKDSSTTFVDIAKQIGVSDATIHIRVRRLRETGVIGNFTISVDNRRLGYDHLVFMGVNVGPGFA